MFSVPFWGEVRLAGGKVRDKRVWFESTRGYSNTHKKLQNASDRPFVFRTLRCRRAREFGSKEMTQFLPVAASPVGFPVFAIDRGCHGRSGEPSKMRKGKMNLSAAQVQILNVHIQEAR